VLRSVDKLSMDSLNASGDHAGLYEKYSPMPSLWKWSSRGAIVFSLRTPATMNTIAPDGIPFT